MLLKIHLRRVGVTVINTITGSRSRIYHAGFYIFKNTYSLSLKMSTYIIVTQESDMN